MTASCKAFACVFVGMLLSHACRADERIALYFNERPPYQFRLADGSVSGLTATPAAGAFKVAGVPFVWVNMPTSRQFLLIQRNMAPACMIGVYRLPEREQYAKFTKPIYRNEHTVGLVHDGIDAADGVGVAELLSRHGLRVLVKEMYSYGGPLDALLARYKPQIVRTTNENMQMAKMITMKQADVMFVSEEEARVLQAQLRVPGTELRIVHFSDAPPALDRHIMCSRQVSDDIIARLNRAIR